MVLCVESCTGLNGGRECVMLEIQVLVTEDGIYRKTPISRSGLNVNNLSRLYN